ncbi:MAG TPA: phosphoribosylanthranilate isomerase [Acidocella sp.]|nr:phosphoribosylanthranilate isomerase [Acidocella sp.]
MWIKICGITQLEDAQHALRSGADAIGFVFAPSPRRITPQAACQITRELPPSLEKIGVFVNTPIAEIRSACEIAGLSGVQLHDESPNRHSPTLASDLHVWLQHLSPRPRIIEVMHYDGNSASVALQFRALRAQPEPDPGPRTVLVDTRIAGKVGGTGTSFDWQAAQDLLLRHASDLHWVVAGGLHPENVRDAIQILRPWGVDVSSGVESSPGRKDHTRVEEFIRVARTAAAEFAEAAQR